MTSQSNCTALWIALGLVCIGGVNWGLVGAFDFNLVKFLVGSVPMLERMIYGLVGLSSLYVGIYSPQLCKRM